MVGGNWNYFQNVAIRLRSRVGGEDFKDLFLAGFLGRLWEQPFHPGSWDPLCDPVPCDHVLGADGPCEGELP
jgi:hypothetical protein